METTPDFVLRIKQLYPQLQGQHRAVADYLLSHPRSIPHLRVKDIARECKCDDSRVTRFCQRLGYDGFPSLRASAAEQFMPVEVPEAGESDGGDRFSRTLEEFRRENVRVINDTLGLLDRATVASATEALTRARRIHLLGVGGSGLVALDTTFKLQRLGLQAVYNRDADLNRMLCGLTGEEDVVLAVSFSGDTGEVCDCAERCGRNGAVIIAVTNFPDSRLATISDLVLLTASEERQYRLSAMTSRLAQQLVLDFIVISLALENMERTEQLVRRTHDMLRRP